MAKWVLVDLGGQEFARISIFKKAIHLARLQSLSVFSQSYPFSCDKSRDTTAARWTNWQGGVAGTVLSTHQWTQESTDRRSCPLCPHRWRRSCRAPRHTRSRRSGSERPGNPAHRNRSSRPRGLCISPCFGTGSASTGPLLGEARQETLSNRKTLIWAMYIPWIDKQTTQQVKTQARWCPMIISEKILGALRNK